MNRNESMKNLFSKNQTKSLIPSFFGLVLIVACIVAPFHVVIQDSQLIFWFAPFIAGIILFLRYPINRKNHRKSVKRMLARGITEDQIDIFNREFEQSREVFAGFTRNGGSVVALTDNWIYELNGKYSSLFPIAGIVQMYKDVEYYSHNGFPDATYVHVKCHFNDNRSVRIRVKDLKPKDSLALADDEFMRVLEYLFKRAPHAQIGLPNQTENRTKGT